MNTPMERDPVSRLREAMQEIRDVRAAAGMVIDFARYDSDTLQTNTTFINDLYEALPVKFFVGPSHKDGYFITRDANEMRTISAVGVMTCQSVHTSLSYRDDCDGVRRSCIVIGQKRWRRS